jgi:hypothetical protein
LVVPAAVRVVSKRELSWLIDAAEGAQLGWDANGLNLNEEAMYLLLPYGYEERSARIWKCRVLAFADGLSVEVGRGKQISLARLDVALDVFVRLPVASRKVERQLLHWLAWKVAAAGWKSGCSGE